MNRDIEEGKRLAEIEKQQLQVEELERAIAEITPQNAAKFDAPGQNACADAIEEVKIVIAQGNPKTIRPLLNNAQQFVSQHRNEVAGQLAIWQKNLNQANQAKCEMDEIMAGLQADQVFMRWQSESLKQLDTFVTRAEVSIQNEQFSLVRTLLKQLDLKSKDLILEANQSQLKADVSRNSGERNRGA